MYPLACDCIYTLVQERLYVPTPKQQQCYILILRACLFPQPCIVPDRPVCSHSTMFPLPHVPTAPCSHCTISASQITYFYYLLLVPTTFAQRKYVICLQYGNIVPCHSIAPWNLTSPLLSMKQHSSTAVIHQITCLSLCNSHTRRYLRSAQDCGQEQPEKSAGLHAAKYQMMQAIQAFLAHCIWHTMYGDILHPILAYRQYAIWGAGLVPTAVVSLQFDCRVILTRRQDQDNFLYSLLGNINKGNTSLFVMLGYIQEKS